MQFLVLADAHRSLAVFVIMLVNCIPLVSAESSGYPHKVGVQLFKCIGFRDSTILLLISYVFIFIVQLFRDHAIRLFVEIILFSE